MPTCVPKKSKIIENNRNIYSYFYKNFKFDENLILKNMQNYKCYNCGLIYKKMDLSKEYQKIYNDFQPCILGV